MVKMYTMTLICVVLLVKPMSCPSVDAATIRNNIVDQANAINEIDARIYFDRLPGLMPPMLPIEINVPELIMGMMNELMLVWTAMSEYFSTENSVVPRIEAILDLTL